MKIVHALGWYLPDSLGGTEVYVAGLCRRQREAGHDVRVVAPGADERSYRFDDIEVFRYPTPAAPTRDEAQGRAPVRGAERLHAWLARERPDVLHVHTLTTSLGLPELEAGRRAGARVIVTSHESSLGFLCQRGTLMRWGERTCDGLSRPAKCAACVLAGHGWPRPLAWAAGLFPDGPERLPGRVGTALGMAALIRHNQRRQRALLDGVEAFVVLTETARRMLLANGAPPARVVLNRLGVGEGLVRKPERATTAPITVGYLGRYDRVKGVHDLVAAVVSLPRDVKLRLELRGPDGGPREEAVRAELRALAGDDPRVQFVEAVSWAAVGEVLSRWDLVACPSRCLEGGPTVALEAHAVGTPVVGARIGGLAEILPDDGRLFAPGDRAALARLLARAAAEPALLDRWRRALPPARTLDEVARDYLALYEGA
jgi:glycosyltransferase involved in cell wall biosynthesis